MSEFKRDMDEIWIEIEKATDDIDVPDSLLPERIVEELKQNEKKKERRRMRRITEMAAAVAVVVAVGGVGIYQMNNSGKFTAENAMMQDSVDSVMEEEIAESTMDMAMSSGTDKDSAEEKEAVTKKQKKQKVGDEFHLAKNYDEIYDLIPSNDDRDKEGLLLYEDGVESFTTGSNSGSASADKEMAKEESAADVSTGSNENSYSSTNKQEEGIDESDTVKTDGKYVYRVWKNKIYIVDIQNKKMKTVSTIQLDTSVSSEVREIYLDGDKLCVISEERVVSMNNEDSDSSAKEETIVEDEGAKAMASEEVADLIDVDEVYYMDKKVSTKLSVYNISDRTKPVLEGSVEQDGNYYTSRKVNDVVYVFTNKNLYRIFHKEDVIPYVQGKQVEADCIYLPNERASGELIATSVNMNHPEKVVDQMVIMNSYANIYMGQNAIYLYNTDYSSDQEYTDISKFKYDSDGTMMGVNATSVKGSIEDTFAISEKKNNLRVLTTDWSKADRVNQLYILDNEMKLLGKIEDIAKGESIYAARYVGDMAYFITYRNTDPLFVADLSNAAKPKLLGEVKISGFSDYLHSYGNNKMLGIGYETDEDSMRLGVKLCMFDVKNPKKPKVLSSYVMKDADNTPADNNYKCVLVDQKKNMIGFMVEDIDAKCPYTYKVFSWKNGEFKEVFSRKFKTKGYLDMNEVRGMYAGSNFYLVKNSVIISYDMKNNYKQVDFLKLK